MAQPVTPGNLLPPLPLPVPTTPFETCLAFTLEQEGGYNNVAGDTPTNLGITLATLASWRDEATTIQDVRDLSREMAAAIYSARYWLPMGADRMPPAVALMVFDSAVNIGVYAATVMLQEAVGAKQDGTVGIHTLADVARIDPRSLVYALGRAQRLAYHRYDRFDEFGAGWLARCSRRQIAAMAMLTPVPVYAVGDACI